MTYKRTVIGDQGAGRPVKYGFSTYNMTSDADVTLPAVNLVNPILKITSGVSLTATRNIVLPTGTAGAIFYVFNGTTGGQSLTFVGSSGTGITVANAANASITFDGTNYINSAGASTGGGGGITALTGDVTASGSGSQAATVVSVSGGSFGSGTNVVAIAASATAPTSNPGSGGYLYEKSGVLKHRATSGAIEDLAPVGQGTQNTQLSIVNRYRAYFRTNGTSAVAAATLNLAITTTNQIIYMEVYWSCKNTSTIATSLAGKTTAAFSGNFTAGNVTPAIMSSGIKSGHTTGAALITVGDTNGSAFTEVVYCGSAGIAAAIATSVMSFGVTTNQISIFITPPGPLSGVTQDWQFDIYMMVN